MLLERNLPECEVECNERPVRDTERVLYLRRGKARPQQTEILYIFFGNHAANVVRLADRIEQRGVFGGLTRRHEVNVKLRCVGKGQCPWHEKLTKKSGRNDRQQI